MTDEREEILANEAEEIEETVYEYEDEEEPATATSASSQRRPAGSRSSGSRRRKRGKACAFCVEKVNEIDYKQTDLLRNYLTTRAKIKSRRQSGLCAKHQRRLAVAIKRARHMALLPFTSDQFTAS